MEFGSFLIPLGWGVLWLLGIAIALLLGYTAVVGRWEGFGWFLFALILSPAGAVPTMDDPHLVVWYLESVIGALAFTALPLLAAIAVYRYRTHQPVSFMHLW